MTLQERIKRSQQVGSEAKQPTINQLAAAADTPVPNTAVSAGMVPGATADQAKMMGTPAQKQAKVATLGGETQLEQAQKLRAPSEATVEDEAKKRRAAAIAQGMGTMGDKANELIDRTFANITGQQVQAAPTTAPAAGEAAPEAAALSLKLDTAAKQLEGKSDTEVAAITALINNIATEADPAKRNAATLELNKQLGLTGANALSADMVPGLIAKLPETVAQAAQTQVKATIEGKLTLEDFGNLGTSPAELAKLLKVDESAIADMSLTDLDNALSALTQTEFGETQTVQAGMASGLLSQTEKNALRDVLATLEERGVAGAEFQVGQVAKDVVDGRQVTVGGQQYDITELLATDEMTDIVTQVLNDEKSEFSLSLKETSPDLYNWIVSSRAGLENLVKEAGKGVGTFKAVQEKNLKLLAPFAGQKDYMQKLGLDIDALSAVDLTEEVTLADGTKVPRWKAPKEQGGLPPAAQLLLSLPPEKQGISLTNLSQLPASEIEELSGEELLALGLDRTNGLWSQYKEAKDNRAKIASIPNNQISTIVSTLGWPDVDTLNKTLADAVLVEAMGGPRHPLLDIDGNNTGSLDAEDMAKLKEAAAGGELPSLKDIVASGQVPKVSVPNAAAALDHGDKPVFDDMKRVLADGFFTQEEADALTWDLDKMQSVLNSMPKRNGAYIGPGAYIANTLQGSIERRRKKKADEDAAASEAARRAAEETVPQEGGGGGGGELRKRVAEVALGLPAGSYDVLKNPKKAEEQVTKFFKKNW